MESLNDTLKFSNLKFQWTECVFHRTSIKTVPKSNSNDIISLGLDLGFRRRQIQIKDGKES